MSKGYNRWEKFYHQLSIVFHGIIALSMIPFAWAFLETQRQFPSPPLVEGNTMEVIRMGGPLLLILILFLSYRYGQRIINYAKSRSSIEEKLNAYLVEKRKDYLLLELGAFIAFLGLYLTKDQLFSMMYVAVLMMFSTKRPTYYRITQSLELSDEEINEWIGEEKNKDDRN